MNKDIAKYNHAQSTADKVICELLAQEISQALPEAESKIWHGSPVWFLEGNPIVGYSQHKNGVRVLFWSGQSFDEKKLQVEGNFKAAQIQYTKVEEISKEDLKSWLNKAKTIQWDYKNIVKRQGVLERLK